MSSKSLDKRHPLSPELSERLKPDKADRHYSNRDHHDFQRRRHHRRANKRGRRHRPRDRTPPLTSASASNQDQSGSEAGGTQKPTASSKNSTSRSSGELHRRPPPSSKHLVLRPTKGPLLNAPKNSTQFIIDDHETSPFFDDDVEMSSSGEEITPKKYNTRSRQASTSSSRRVSASESSPQRSPEKTRETVAASSIVAAVTTTTTASNALSQSASAVTSSSTGSSNSSIREVSEKTPANSEKGQATPGNYVVNDDDYTLWAEFSERDFQSVYESAHQEQVADWDRHRLIEEITNLEKRQKELVNILARIDPEMYAQRLEDQLEALQEKNRILRSANGLSPEAELDDDPEVMITKPLSPPQESPDSSTKE